MRGPPDARDIGSCRCVAQRRENGWGLIEEAPNHLPQCGRRSEIFAKLIEHFAVECGAGRDSLFLDRRRGRSFGCGGGRQRPVGLAMSGGMSASLIGLQGHALSDYLRIGERPVELF